MADEVKRRPRDVFLAIQVAVANGRGLNLTFDECVTLSLVSPLDAIAFQSLEDRGYDNPSQMTLDDIAKVKP